MIDSSGNTPQLDRARLGARISAARRRAGLTQRELAKRLGISCWQAERLEAGEGDLQPLLHLALTSQKSEAELLDDLEATDVQSKGTRDGAAQETPVEHTPSRDDIGRHLVLGTLMALIMVRFFTEVISVLPKPLTFIDVPLFFLLIAVAIGKRRPTASTGRSSHLAALALLFLVAVAVSAITNPSRVAPAPALLFLYGFLSPVAVYWAVLQLWPTGNTLAFSRLLVGLLVINLAVVAGIELPRFLSSNNPDEISGTFGENAYQLVFFLLVVSGLLVGMIVLEPQRLAARLAPFLLVGAAVTIFLAQYRALLVTTLLSVLLVSALLTLIRGRAVIIGTLAVLVFLICLGFVASRFPVTKYDKTFEEAQKSPTQFLTARLSVADDVFRVYSNPQHIVTGTGPGTFSSRAWRTFAETQVVRTSVAPAFALALNGGPYRTDVGERYTVRRIRSAGVISGSSALSLPFASYLALLGEVGVVGTAALVSIYLAGFLRAVRLFLVASRRSPRGHPLPALLLAAVVAFFVMLQLAALDNWLEVTKITFLSWALLAVGERELTALGTR